MLRGRRVILDRDLAALYGVSTGNLNKAVSRNIDRFPGDFLLQLTGEGLRNLKFHFGTSSRGGTRKPPRAFKGAENVGVDGDHLRRSLACLSTASFISAIVLVGPE
jgi:hypothetical protein